MVQADGEGGKRVYPIRMMHPKEQLRRGFVLTRVWVVGARGCVDLC